MLITGQQAKCHLEEGMPMNLPSLTTVIERLEHWRTDVLCNLHSPDPAAVQRKLELERFHQEKVVRKRRINRTTAKRKQAQRDNANAVIRAAAMGNAARATAVRRQLGVGAVQTIPSRAIQK